MSGPSRRSSFDNWRALGGPSTSLPGVRFHLARGLNRSEAMRKASMMLREREPGVEVHCFEYDRRTGIATAIRKPSLQPKIVEPKDAG